MWSCNKGDIVFEDIVIQEPAIENIVIQDSIAEDFPQQDIQLNSEIDNQIETPNVELTESLPLSLQQDADSEQEPALSPAPA